jgi:hypothetical protein
VITRAQIVRGQQRAISPASCSASSAAARVGAAAGEDASNEAVRRWGGEVMR